MYSRVGYEAQWSHISALERYEESRTMVAPALSLAFRQALEYLPENADVLEIGAGTGALVRYAGHAVDAFQWTESDQNPEFLAAVRPQKYSQVVACLPEIPLEPQSMDAVVGLGVLDTMETGAVEQSMQRIHDTLRENGVLLHIMDMVPDPLAEIYNSHAEGLFPLPFIQLEDLGLCYIDTNDLSNRAAAAGIDKGMIRVLSALVTDPNQYLPLANKNGILTYLGSIVTEKGLTVRAEPSWMKHFGDRLTAIAEKCGFRLLTNDYIEAEDVQARSALPSPFREADKIFRKFGGVGIDPRPGLHMPNFVKARAHIHVLAVAK